MAKLRDPDRGCEWDISQNFSSIAPYTIEEAYEVADAIDKGDMEGLRDELGDLLFQVVFHARMAEEERAFTFSDVARSIADKMVFRHPHIFADERDGIDEERWEDLKQVERLDKGETSAMDSVAHALPALLRAQKLQKRAARTGFDWPSASGPKAKIFEEMHEFEFATSSEDQVEEAGDLLFAVVNFLRANGVTAEDALRCANSKFERRFREMENLAEGNFSELDLSEQERLWQTVKSSEKRRSS